MGRNTKDHIAKYVKVARKLVEGADSVRDQGETFTDQVEDGLRRHIAAKLRAKRRGHSGASD